MKTNEPNQDDKPLSKALKEWRVEAPLPPGFQDAVWRRIERAQATPTLSVWGQIAEWIVNSLPRPALAASYLAVLLTVGGTMGWVQARHANSRLNGELGLRYVRTLDPYQAPRQ